MNKFLSPKISALALLVLLAPVFVSAQSGDEYFQAKVVEILDQREVVAADGVKFIQQKISLIGLEGERQDREFIFDGLDDYQVVKNSLYQPGDRVLAVSSPTDTGEDNYYIVDYIRYPSLYWLVFIFVLIVALIGRGKGLRALLGLVFSFVIIMKLIVPQILAGVNPLAIAIFGAVLILLFVVYLTEGWKQKSHLAILSMVISLLGVGMLAVVFVNLAKLTGLAQEEVLYLVGFGEQLINFRGLLLAGIIIGTLGVLDDAVISQIASVAEIKEANPNLPPRQVYRQAARIGVSHMSSIINTLFLVYAGAALPLLLLFSLNEPPFLTFNQIINHDLIATEIVRTLAGSIGLILSIPIATFLASYFLKIPARRS